jgi:hypothetical protein
MQEEDWAFAKLLWLESSDVREGASYARGEKANDAGQLMDKRRLVLTAA